MSLILQKIRTMNALENTGVPSYQVKLTPKEALMFAKIGHEHSASHAEMQAVVMGCNAIIPGMQFDEGNPNNGKPFHTFKIGLEYSRVIYVSIVKEYLKGRFDEDFYTDLETTLKGIKGVNADEMDVVENNEGEFVFRWWWD